MKFTPKTKSRLGVGLLFISDVIMLMGIFYLSILVRKWIFPLFFDNLPVFYADLKTYYWIFPIWFFIFLYEGAYTRRFSFWDEVKFLWKCTFFASLAIFTILFIGKQGARFSRGLIMSMFFLSFILLPIIRPFVKKLIYSLGLMKRKVLIIGAGNTGRLALSALKNEPNLGYEVAGFIDDIETNPGSIEGVKIHRGIDKVERYIKRCGIQDIVIAKPDLEKKRLMNIINRIQHKVENTLFIPDLAGIAVLGTELRHFFHEQTMVIEIKNNLERLSNYIMKRVFDYSIAIMLFPLLMILIIVISLIIRLTSKGPAIFKQERIGKNGKTFICYKFRTMYIDAEERLKEILESDPEARAEWEKHWKLKNDPRVTRVGRFLRKTSLDELPQIFNVLKGEMSLVGPRPYLPRERDFLKEFGEVILSVPPGITGLWQTSGRSEKTYQERLILDSWYVRNWNLWLDIVILLKTVGVVFEGDGAC